mmetsp:Transcript_62767/g.132568  ORF Transcript_62767/g.132568 Transcript_62767/m.132568 type:complete len:236 (-) Transcript_62767:536-1243(-)
MILRREGSQSTGFVSCFLRRATISSGWQPGRMGSAEAFIQTVCLGDFILGSISSRAAESLSCAGCMSGVWKAPEVFKTFAWRAPAASTAGRRASIAFFVPPTAKPLGKSSFAIWQTPSLPSSARNFSHRGTSLAFSSPATESINCSPTEAASCIASPRSFTRVSPSSKLNTPAAQRAVYSPKLKPAMTAHLSTAAALSMRSFSTAAKPPTNMAGWQYLVSESLSSGPSRQSARRS